MKPWKENSRNARVMPLETKVGGRMRLLGCFLLVDGCQLLLQLSEEVLSGRHEVRHVAWEVLIVDSIRCIGFTTFDTPCTAASFGYRVALHLVVYGRKIFVCLVSL